MLAEVQSARGRVAAVRAALQSGSLEELGRCIPLLDEAISSLRTLEADPSCAGGDLAREVDLARDFDALRFELGVARRVIEGGAALYQGWAKVLATAAAGYTPQGEPAPLLVAATVSVEG